MKKIFLIILVFCFFTACDSYNSSLQFSPAGAKKIYIKAIDNNTNQYGLESKLTLAVSDEMLNDGRLSLSDDQDDNDGILSITIKRYLLRPLTYGANMVADQYRLWIVADILFTDSQSGEELWKESVNGIQIYLDANRVSGDSVGDALTESEAQDAVIEKLARSIVRRIIKGYI